MFIKLVLSRQIDFLFKAGCYLPSDDHLQFPYKYNINLHLFFIQKFYYYPKFSIISLFLETPPKSLLSIPLDSLKREDSRTFFRTPFHNHTRSHAPPEDRRVSPLSSTRHTRPASPSQPADVICHVSRRRSPLTPRQHTWTS